MYLEDSGRKAKESDGNNDHKMSHLCMFPPPPRREKRPSSFYGLQIGFPPLWRNTYNTIAAKAHSNKTTTKNKALLSF
jgi:hypothetical protein